MSTLADELLNDFGDSGSEGEQNGLHDEEEGFKQETNIHDNPVDMNIDTKLDDKGDIDMTDVTTWNVDDGRDIENLSFGHIHDVRSISTMRGTLDPILEVS